MSVKSVVSYPFEEDGLTHMLIGGVLSLLSVLLVPVVIVLGYYYEVLYDTIAGGTTPPEFTTDNIGRLAVKGLGVIGVTLLYVSVWAGVVLVSLYIFEPPIAGPPGANYDTQALYTVLAVFLATPCVLSYPANASFISYAATDSITSAVSPRNIIDVMTSKKYLVVNTIILICGIVFVIVISVVQLLPVFGQFAAPFIQFPVLVVLWHALGTVGETVTEQSDVISK